MPHAKRVLKIETGKRDHRVTYSPRLDDLKMVKTHVSAEHKEELRRQAKRWRTSEGNYLRMLIETFLKSGMEIQIKPED